MKKFIKIICLLLVTCMCFTLCSCSVLKTGTYKFKSASVGNLVYEVGDKFLGETLEEDYCILKLKTGGKAIFIFDGDEEQGTWEANGNVIKVTIDGKSTNFIKEGKTLVFELASMEYVLSK